MKKTMTQTSEERLARIEKALEDLVKVCTIQEHHARSIEKLAERADKADDTSLEIQKTLSEMSGKRLATDFIVRTLPVIIAVGAVALYGIKHYLT